MKFFQKHTKLLAVILLIVFNLVSDVPRVIESFVPSFVEGLIPPGVDSVVHEVAVVAYLDGLEEGGLLVAFEEADSVDFTFMQIVNSVI